MLPSFGTVLGFLGAVVPRYYISKVYISKGYLDPRQAIVFNPIDMMVSAAAYWVFKDMNRESPTTHDLAVGMLVASRIAGCFSGFLSLEVYDKNEVSVLVLLNVASLAGSYFLRHFYDRAQQNHSNNPPLPGSNSSSTCSGGANLSTPAQETYNGGQQSFLPYQPAPVPTAPAYDPSFKENPNIVYF